MAKEYGFAKSKTLKHIETSDKNRADLKKYYMGKKVRFADYDVVLNVSTLSKKEICLAIVSMIQEKAKR
jgi:hypothetical protein